MGKKSQLTLKGSLWIEADQEPVIGPGRVELLERIQQCGSIRQAAMQMKMSYRQAWLLVDHMNANLYAPVVISHRGGKGGGNAEVTVEGQKVIEQFRFFHEKFQQFLAGNSVEIKLKAKEE